MRLGRKWPLANGTLLDPSHSRSRLSQSSHLLRVGLVQPQRSYECRLAARPDASAIFVFLDGLYGLRIDRRGRAAGLVAAYESGTILIRR
jgi:hypothetical protein